MGQESKKIFTDSGIEIKKLYSGNDIPKDSMEEAPGQFPFTRGIQPDMYRGKMWTMRQYAGFSTAEESNRRYHYLLSHGVMGLSVAFDLPTQLGYDSDHQLAEGEVGKVGVAIDSLDDIETLFNGIRLQDITTSMTINATAFILLALYVALAKKQGADLLKISGTVQNDILKEYAARGTYIYPPKPSMRIITDIFEWCGRELPKWNTISISGYHIREAGSTAVQEVAFTLSNGKAYVKAALKKGLDINVFGKRLSFFFNSHNHLFEEAAKFRAARRMWAKIMKELGATDPQAMRRLRGMAALDPEIAQGIHGRDARRPRIALEILKRPPSRTHTKLGPGQQRMAADVLSMLTSFESYDALARAGQTEAQILRTLTQLARCVINNIGDEHE